MPLVRNVSYLFGAQSVNAVLSFAVSVYLTRILGAEGRGMYALYTNALTLAVLFFGMSVSSTLVFLINSQKVETEELLTFLIGFSFLSTLALVATSILLALLGHSGLVVPEQIAGVGWVAPFALLYILTLVTSINAVLLSAYKQFSYVSLLSILPTAASLCFYLYLYHSGAVDQWGVLDRFRLVIASTIAITAIHSLAGLSSFHFTTKRLPGRHTIPWKRLKPIVGMTAIVFAGNVVQFLSYRLDFWFVDAYSGKAALGVYSLASQLAQLIWIVPTAMGSVLYSYAAGADRELADRYTGSLATFALVGCVALGITEVFVMRVLVIPLYGASFVEAVPLIAILMIGIVVLGPAILLSSYFASRGLYKFNLYGTLLGTSSCLVLYPVLINKYNLVGAAAASVIAYTLNAALLLYLAKREGIVFFPSALADARLQFNRLLGR
jgi:O-antigen/teichoic acid export membrane protein